MSEDIREDDDQEGNTSVVLDDDSDGDIEVVTSGKTRTNVHEDSGDADDDELSSYTDKVKRRINQLTSRRKQASEEAMAAYQYAEQVRAENSQMKQRLEQLGKGYQSEQEGRINAQEVQAKRALTEAYEAGDFEKVADAQSAIAQIAIAKERVRIQKARQAQADTQAAQQAQVQAQQPQQPQRPDPRQDPKLQKWLSKNEWFGQDRVLTRAAQAIHEQLVLEEDYDPTSTDYYSEIDKRLRSVLPNKFKSEQRNAKSVTPASGNGRTLKTGRKKAVELTPGQVAFAQKMRIPLETYAREVAKLNNRRD